MEAETSTVPTNVLGLSGVTAISSYVSHTRALTDQGSVWCWGFNACGQLGDTSFASRGTATEVMGLPERAIAIGTGGGLATDQSARNGHTCAELEGGGVYCWGYNAYGQLGDGTNVDHAAPAPVLGLTRAVEVAGGGGHTCALDVDGALRCWRYNSFAGQLGDPSRADHSLPFQVPGVTSGDRAQR